MTVLVLEQQVVNLLAEHRNDIIGVHRVAGPEPGRHRVSAATSLGQELVLKTGMELEVARAYRDEAEDCLISARIGVEYPDPDAAPREIPTPRKPHVTRGMPQPEIDLEAVRQRARCAFHLLDREASLREIATQRLLPVGVWRLIGAGQVRRCRRVYWHRLGLDKRGYPHRTSYSHYAVDPDRTLCGHPIPGSDTHVVTIGAQEGPSECHLCAALTQTGAQDEQVR